MTPRTVPRLTAGTSDRAATASGFVPRPSAASVIPTSLLRHPRPGTPLAASGSRAALDGTGEEFGVSGSVQHRKKPASAPPDADHLNEVLLVGRLAAEPLRRELPSGDVLMSFRLVVHRQQKAKASLPGSPTVDTLECAAWRRDVQRSLSGAQPGDVLEVHGSLRRRFWRSPAGTPASRSEVEAARVRKVRKATVER
ncbi:MAG: single-strand DNA-binding protein [Actinomycetota bacterium]|nr:single-strand DNA-binding protein [Actinomycetota bacterium]